MFWYLPSKGKFSDLELIGVTSTMLVYPILTEYGEADEAA